jgi:hypothetical protein
MDTPLRSPDDVACAVLERYDSLPKAGKPIIRSNGVHEWTILAGIVVQPKGGDVSNLGAILTPTRFEFTLLEFGNRRQMSFE